MSSTDSVAPGYGAALAGPHGMGEKRFVYVIQSERAATQHYVGLTWNVMTRLASHNAGESPHTRRHCPWRLVVVMAFSTEAKAAAFEKFLKSGPGAAFLQRYFLV